jgi:hypothetical protein
MKDFYILSLSYTGTAEISTDTTITNANASSSVLSMAGGGTAMQIRVGYFGYCLITNSTTSCSSDAASLTTSIRETGSGDPLNLLYVAKQFHDNTIFSGLM